MLSEIFEGVGGGKLFIFYQNDLIDLLISGRNEMTDVLLVSADCEIYVHSLVLGKGIHINDFFFHWSFESFLKLDKLGRTYLVNATKHFLC